MATAPEIDIGALPDELRQAAVLLSEWLNGGGVLQVRPRSVDNLRSAADEIIRLREANYELHEALVIATAWMPTMPLTMSAWTDLCRVNTALGWSIPPKPIVENT